MSVDAPVRQILPDLAILGIAQKQPRSVEELSQARGIDERHWRGNLGKEIVAAVQEGLRSEVSMPVPEGDDLDRGLRPAVTLVSAWVSEVARQEKIDTTLLGTRGDIIGLLRNDPSSRLATGWRAELLGDYAAVGVDHLQVRLGTDPAAALDELEQLAELWPPTSPY